MNYISTGRHSRSIHNAVDAKPEAVAQCSHSALWTRPHAAFTSDQCLAFNGMFTLQVTAAVRTTRKRST